MNRYQLYGIEVRTAFPFTWPVPPCPPRGGGQGSTFAGAPAPGEEQPTLEFTWSTGGSKGADGLPPLPASSMGETTWVSGGGSKELPELLRFGGVADYFLGPHRIHCRLMDPQLQYLVEIQFLGMVLALWLLGRGVPVLHAAAVTVKGDAAAFVGEKGQGKTTLAAAMVARGHPFLADDLLALSPGTASLPLPRAHAGVPLLRVTDAQIAGVGLPPAGELVHPAFPKRKLEVGRGWGRFHPDPAPLTRIYLPSPTLGSGHPSPSPSGTDGAVGGAEGGDPGQGHPAGPPPGSRKAGGRAAEIRIEAVPGSHTLPLLLGHSFLAGEAEAWGLTQKTLQTWLGVAPLHRFSLRRIHYPVGFEHLPAVVRAVEADMAEDRRRSPAG